MGGLIEEPPMGGILTPAVGWGDFLQGVLGNYANLRMQREYLREQDLQRGNPLAGLGANAPAPTSSPAAAIAQYLPLILGGAAVVVVVAMLIKS